MAVQGPLSGITVLDLTRVLAGPNCTAILYKLGARIIKVENPVGGDDARQFPPFLPDGESAYASVMNHGKESIALDTRRNPDDKLLFDELVKRVDILVENFRPGVLTRLGYDDATLLKLNPRLIISHISGFGQTGPASQLPSYDLVAQGMSGLMSLTGEKNRQPVKAGISLGDITGGVFAALSICAALFDRSKHGKGVSLDMALSDVLMSLMPIEFITYTVGRKIPQPTGTRHRLIAPFDVFHAKDKDLIVCAANDHIYVAICEVLGKPELATDERFATNPKRVENVEVLEAIMNAILATKTAAEWIAEFKEKGVPCGPINRLDEVLAEPQIQHRQMEAHFAEGYAPEATFPGNPLKSSLYNDVTEYPRGPKLNEHAQAIKQWVKETPAKPLPTI